jgi:hypothetical protein
MSDAPPIAEWSRAGALEGEQGEDSLARGAGGMPSREQTRGGRQGDGAGDEGAVADG